MKKSANIAVYIVVIVCDNISRDAPAISHLLPLFSLLSKSYIPINTIGIKIKAVYSPTAFLEYISVYLYGPAIYTNAEIVLATLLFVILYVNIFIVIPDSITVAKVNIFIAIADVSVNREIAIGI